MTKIAKYYVDDGYEQAVVDSENPLSACCKAVLHFSTHLQSMVFIKCLENFDEHSDDIIVDSNKIIDFLSKHFKDE